MPHATTTTPPAQTDLFPVFAAIIELAVSSPTSIEEALETLAEIEDRTTAILGPSDGDACPCCGDFIRAGHVCE